MKSIGFLGWHWLTRLVAFWFLTIGLVYALDLALPPLDIGLVVHRVRGGLALLGGHVGEEEAKIALDALSQTDFILSLASFIFAVAFALAATFLVLHILTIIGSIYRLRRVIARQRSREDFAQEYDQSIYHQLRDSHLIGHGWREFDETLLKPSVGDLTLIRNTVRPQSFISFGAIREQFFGLKMMSSIPGYFVAAGLLLTFMGIVLALYKAGAASAAQDVSVMQNAMTELLKIAAFKFATSIAGLGCSLILSIVFKVYTIWLEASAHKFCETVESKLKYVPPQAVAIEIAEAAKEQRDQLKEINSDKFFAQMGRQLEPQIQSAFASAMAPINDSITGVLGKITETSQSGINDMLAQFSSSVQGSAGIELRQLAETLGAMQATLADMQTGVRGSGEDFARRMSEAAENLNRLVGEAARSMDDGANRNRDGLAEILAAMKATFDKASEQVDTELGRAAGGASERIEAAMGRVMEKLESQVTTLTGSMVSLDGDLRNGVAKTQEQIRAAQESAVSTVSAVAAGAAEAIKSGLAEAIATIRQEVERFESALRGSNSALSSQTSALGEATSQTRSVSDAFSKTATDIRSASGPLLQSGEKIASATSNFEDSLRSAVEALTASQFASEKLNTALREQSTSMAEIWRNYEVRFARIDEALAKSISDLATATERQGDTLSRYATDVDRGLANAVNTLSSSVKEMSDSFDEFSGSISDLRSSVRPAAE
ncbi:anti-phage defense ZorAB system protein ZorA [Rhizobium sp. YTUHZ045]|uniref:anti-phage ZorAB system protein ZorA n=1 Tax=Rhizobium sp. YTUHZ045 TaxID=2962888 RepID=UPI003DAA43C1